VTVAVSRATAADTAELAAVAARTFPLACPPTTTADDIADFVATHLSEARFAEYVADPDRTVLVGRVDAAIVGYVMLVGASLDTAADDVRHAVTTRPATELSKCYVLPQAHGTGAAAALVTAALDAAAAQGAAAVWLGVNQENARAQRFYGKHGFTVAGTKTFHLGAAVENDYVMVCPL
jgi:ribosomal protein S18 acetylase RimI-like enzyme